MSLCWSRPFDVLGKGCLSLLLIAFCNGSFGADAEAAAIRWSLYDDSSRSFDQIQAVIEYGCDRLRKSPPSVQNAQVNTIQCGAQSSADAGSRQIKINYTLKIRNLSLDQESFSKSTFTVLRKPYCPSPQYPYLQEENNTAMRFSCWRCPMSDLAARPPRFIGTDKVRWYRSNLCPVEYDLKKPVELQVLAGMTIQKPQALPKAFGFGDYEATSLYVLRETNYGRVLLLNLPDGRQLMFIGEGNSNELNSEDGRGGQLLWRNEQWVWQTIDKAEYQFAAQETDVFKVISKRNPDGRRWQYRWQTFTVANLIKDWRMESVIDPIKQHYQFQYSKQGRLIGLAVQGKKFTSNKT